MVSTNHNLLPVVHLEGPSNDRMSKDCWYEEGWTWVEATDCKESLCELEVELTFLFTRYYCFLPLKKQCVNFYWPVSPAITNCLPTYCQDLLRGGGGHLLLQILLVPGGSLSTQSFTRKLVCPNQIIYFFIFWFFWNKILAYLAYPG